MSRECAASPNQDRNGSENRRVSSHFWQPSPYPLHFQGPHCSMLPPRQEQGTAPAGRATISTSREPQSQHDEELSFPTVVEDTAWQLGTQFIQQHPQHHWRKRTGWGCLSTGHSLWLCDLPPAQDKASTVGPAGLALSPACSMRLHQPEPCSGVTAPTWGSQNQPLLPFSASKHTACPLLPPWNIWDLTFRSHEG